MEEGRICFAVVCLDVWGWSASWLGVLILHLLKSKGSPAGCMEKCTDVASALQPSWPSGIPLVSHLSGEASPGLCCRKPFPDAFLRGEELLCDALQSPKTLSGLGKGKEGMVETKF